MNRRKFLLTSAGLILTAPAIAVEPELRVVSRLFGKKIITNNDMIPSLWLTLSDGCEVECWFWLGKLHISGGICDYEDLEKFGNIDAVVKIRMARLKVCEKFARHYTAWLKHRV